jgi:glycosyltransferase involved in cell wall biosynthesis
MRITVVTVCYNSAATIRDTLSSVHEQDWPDLEHVIIDGASTDTTADIVAGFKRDSLRFFSEPDKGIYDAMNKGIKNATGDYIIFLNSDDFFARPDAVRLLATRAQETDADFIFGDTQFVETPGNPFSKRLYSARGFRPWWLRCGVMPPHPSMAARRKTLVNLRGFDTETKISGDFDLLARAILSQNCSWATLPVITTMFRTGGVSTQGLRSKLISGREMAKSLARIGQPFSKITIHCRYLIKARQLL